MSENIQTVVDWWPRLWDAIVVTLQLSVGGAIVALIIAVVLGLASITKIGVLRIISRIIVEFFRGTSLVVQLFWLFFVLPQFGYQLEPLACGILALGLNYGAYGAEVVRGSLNAVPEGQWETTTALSMPWITKMRRIIWPQAWALMLPGLNNLMIMLIKGTALALLIFLHDVTYIVDELRKDAGTFIAFGLGFLIYYVIAQAFSAVLRYLEIRAQRRLGFRPSTKASTANATAGAVA